MIPYTTGKVPALLHVCVTHTRTTPCTAPDRNCLLILNFVTQMIREHTLIGILCLLPGRHEEKPNTWRTKRGKGRRELIYQRTQGCSPDVWGPKITSYRIDGAPVKQRGTDVAALLSASPIEHGWKCPRQLSCPISLVEWKLTLRNRKRF